ncbi:MAG: sigma-54-dependent Fis family transcriptional regulator [Verrucomicrobia bacterium]|nr:sigma-54-dependent Fis family transcriptional regulator [Verrucomicrobiota bacterium]
MTDAHAGKSMLIIDDEESICLAFQRFFERRQWQVRIASSAAQGFVEFAASRPSIVFLDIRLPDADGLDVLKRLRAIAPQVPVIMITAYGGIEAVVGSFEGEAFDYLPKPIDLDQAERLVARALEAGGSGAAQSEHTVERSNEPVELIGSSPAMQHVFKRIAVLSKSDCSVLILGATGTGKEVVARAIHRHSRRAARPFFAVNCGALPENLVESELFGHARGAFTGADADRTGKFEAADSGTLFLDEVGELPGAAQVKLLRFLDSQTIERVGSTEPRQLDVRVIAATNRDLPADVRTGRFRADLYYRLAVVQVEVPPLAERPEDIIPLARHFLAHGLKASRGPQRGRAVPQLAPEAEHALLRHTWPGNVRELRNAIAHALAIAPGGRIRVEDLSEAVRSQVARDARPDAGYNDLARQYIKSVSGSGGDLYARAIRPIEAALIRSAMKRCRGNQSEASALLGLHRNTLRKKLRELFSPGDLDDLAQ